jgi:hypothetical protein
MPNYVELHLRGRPEAILVADPVWLKDGKVRARLVDAQAHVVNADFRFDPRKVHRACPAILNEKMNVLVPVHRA